MLSRKVFLILVESPKWSLVPKREENIPIMLPLCDKKTGIIINIPGTAKSISKYSSSKKPAKTLKIIAIIIIINAVHKIDFKKYKDIARAITLIIISAINGVLIKKMLKISKIGTVSKSPTEDIIGTVTLSGSHPR